MKMGGSLTLSANWLLHPLFRVEAGAFLTELEVEDVTSIGVLSDGSEGVFGLDGLTFADRYRRET